jgi:hypothetical protein
MVMTWITRFYVGTVSLVSLVALIYIYAFPPSSMLTSRDGVPHFTPQIMHPETGKALDMGELIRHYRGD